jgi:hypothetical protein
MKIIKKNGLRIIFRKDSYDECYRWKVQLQKNIMKKKDQSHYLAAGLRIILKFKLPIGRVWGRKLDSSDIEYDEKANHCGYGNKNSISVKINNSHRI